MRRIVDPRPASWYTRAYVRAMWWNRDKEAFEGAEHTREVAEERQRKGDHPPTYLTRLLRRVRESTLEGMTTWTVTPRTREPVARVLYLHGGGYVHPLTVDYWRLVRALTSVPAEVVLPAYPLAPAATADEVLPRLLELYRSVERARPRLPTILMGDSAGGALVLALAQMARDQGGPAPARVVALSPWLDVTLAEEQVGDLEPSDPMLAESGLRAAGRWWAAPGDPRRPLVSPLNAALHDLPPIDVYIGSRDILRPAVEVLGERAHETGADVTLHEHPAMFHVWMTRALPEARRTRRDLARLVRRSALPSE